MIVLSLPYALYISSIRSGRNTKGQFTERNKEQLYYSELRGGETS